MTDPQHQYAPGDPVLVAAEFLAVAADGSYSIRTTGGTEVATATRLRIRPADVRPAPSAPTPSVGSRDAALAAARALHDMTDPQGDCLTCSQDWPCETFRVLDAVGVTDVREVTNPDILLHDLTPIGSSSSTRSETVFIESDLLKMLIQQDADGLMMVEDPETLNIEEFDVLDEYKDFEAAPGSVMTLGQAIEFSRRLFARRGPGWSGS